jgi:hypothetical protein
MFLLLYNIKTKRKADNMENNNMYVSRVGIDLVHVFEHTPAVKITYHRNKKYYSVKWKDVRKHRNEKRNPAAAVLTTGIFNYETMFMKKFNYDELKFEFVGNELRFKLF